MQETTPLTLKHHKFYQSVKEILLDGEIVYFPPKITVSIFIFHYFQPPDYRQWHTFPMTCKQEMINCIKSTHSIYVMVFNVTPQKVRFTNRDALVPSGCCDFENQETKLVHVRQQAFQELRI